MLPFATGFLLQGSTFVLDAQTVLTGAGGSVLDSDRTRGFETAGAVGSISDGTSDIYSSASIAGIYWFENYGTPYHALDIPGAANSGWTTLTIGSKALPRASATFAAGRWEWTTTDGGGTQAFGGDGSYRACVFT